MSIPEKIDFQFVGKKVEVPFEVDRWTYTLVIGHRVFFLTGANTEEGSKWTGLEMAHNAEGLLQTITPLPDTEGYLARAVEVYSNMKLVPA